MKKPRTTARAFTDAARHLTRAAKELARAAKHYQKDNSDLTARVLTPGGTRVDHDTRLQKIEQEVSGLMAIVHSIDPESGFLDSLRSILAGVQTLRREERE